MNGLLLDTHVWLWFAEGASERVSDETVRLIESAAAEGSVFLSVISVWELGMLTAKNRLRLSLPVREWLERFLAITHFRILVLESEVALEASLLPGKPHADPADRLLIATARHHNLTLLTRDRKILDYADLGYIRALTP